MKRNGFFSKSAFLGFWLAFVLLGGTATAFAQKLSQPSKILLAEEGVSLELARARREQITDVRYHLKIELAPESKRLKGREEISFTLRAVPATGIIIDFRSLDQNGKIIDGAAADFTVNENPSPDVKQKNGHLIVSAKNLKTGVNRLTLSFESDISASGNRPVIRYTDGEDASQYIYTLFTPMDASLAFPCFDQPDLKARFTLDIIAPENWTVVSNSALAAVKPAETGYRRSVFRETLPISTYLFAFAAGNFREIRNEEAPVPSSLFVRSSQFEKALDESGELFRVTNAGMQRMIAYFDFPFPFPKYDFVLLPGFAFRGMEHAGATFFREDALLFRRQPTEIDRLNRSVLMLHELAHQWFGDTVTMRWFDDLWLKEGFANYVAFAALAAESERPEFVWKRFYQNFKSDAYEADVTLGTTPLRQTILNLKDAKTAYGAVVYTKAPSVLRNLEFVLGDRDFRGGVRLFLRRYAYKNADWRDFIRAFETASGKSLRRWANDYIESRGVSFVETEWGCDAENKIENFTLAQRDALQESGARTIEGRILLVYDDAAAATKTIPYVLATNRLVVRKAIKEKCPAYVFANFYDYGYGYFLLDRRSRRAVQAKIGGISDSFLRSMLWGALWESVRAAETSPVEFVRNGLRTLPAESDEDLARNQLERITRAYQRYLSGEQRKAVIAEFEILCRRQLLNEKIQIGTRINYLRTLYAIAESPATREFLKGLLANETTIPGIELRSADRWLIVTNLLSGGDEQAERLFSAEKSRGVSNDARKQSYVAEATRADAETKRRYFDDYLKGANVPEDWVEASLPNFNSANQSRLTLPFLKRALKELPKIERTRKIFFVLAWLRAFIGGQHSVEALAVVRQFLTSSRIEKNLRLKVLQVSDDLERAVQIRRKFGGEK